jgi:hypothetical protein
MNNYIKYFKYNNKNKNIHNKQNGGKILYNICEQCKLRLNNKDIPFHQNEIGNMTLYIKYFDTIGTSLEKAKSSSHFIDYYEKMIDKLKTKLLSFSNNTIFMCPTYSCFCCKNPLDFQISLSGKVENKDNYHNKKMNKKYNKISKDLLQNDIKTSFQMFCLVKNCIYRELLEEVGLKINRKSLFKSISECFLKNYILERQDDNIKKYYYFVFLNLDNTKYNISDNLEKNTIPQYCKAVYKHQSGGKKEYFPEFLKETVVRISVTLYFNDSKKIENFIYRPQFKYIDEKNKEYYDLLSVGLINKKSYLDILNVKNNENNENDGKTNTTDINSVIDKIINHNLK